MRRLLPAVALAAAACHHGPPPDFVPDPALLDQIREIRMTVTPTACPGETFGATYAALLNDGSAVP
ncbi:MAG: hypothetical protein DMD29_03345, partial [Gemmatimonadetes bacterium]